jgi:glycosyltransferase involved in cell wall biosynthesis
MFVSVVIPTYKGAHFIHRVLESLGNQSFENFEVVTIIKPSADGTEEIVRETLSELDLKHQILFQKEGYFTHALNMGLKCAKGDILLYTDDDAIPPKNWIEEHVYSHLKYRQSGAISGRVINYEVEEKKIRQSEVERPIVRIYRNLFRPILQRPHTLFRQYYLGVYVTNKFTVAAGRCIPYKTCLSLPCRGVNMSFKREAVNGVLFPEHPDLRSAPNNEQYFGAQLVLQGWEAIFNPDSFVFHATRESLSRTKYKKEKEKEKRIMSRLLTKLLEEHC